jgi:multiple sugar transport system substrate-binding protein
MRKQVIVIAAALILAPLGCQAADLVVWWEEGFTPEEDAAVREIIAAFEQDTGKQVELDLLSRNDINAKAPVAVIDGKLPNIPFGAAPDLSYGEWAYEDRLIDLSDVIGPFASLFDPDALSYVTLLNATTGRRAIYALPMGFSTHHLHVWRSLLDQAGITLDDIPKQWDAFWSFWCDEVQAAVRQATGRDDVYGVGLAMSLTDDTKIGFEQFMQAYDANYVSSEGKLVIDDPEIRRRLIRAMDSYTASYRKGCTPPDAIGWDDRGNNKAFLDRAIVMTTNGTLSIPNALKTERPEDYYTNVATIQWPEDADGQPLAIWTGFFAAAAFKDGGNSATVKEFIRFLVAEGWLAHYLDFSGERVLPPMPALMNQPFWLDPSDPHRMAGAMQFLTRPRWLQWNYAVEHFSVAAGDPRHLLVSRESVWPKAIHRVAADGITPEQAVDEAIARIKEILRE